MITRRGLAGYFAASALAPSVLARSAFAQALPQIWPNRPLRMICPAASDLAVTRGAYLVASVGHCGDCHTPRTWLGAPDPRRELAGSKGGIIEGKRAPNITPDAKTGIGDWRIRCRVTPPKII